MWSQQCIDGFASIGGQKGNVGLGSRNRVASSWHFKGLEGSGAQRKSSGPSVVHDACLGNNSSHTLGAR